MSLPSSAHSPVISGVEDLELGKPLYVSNGVMQVKLVITPQGITIAALAEHIPAAKAFLQHAGFPPEKIKKMLCG